MLLPSIFGENLLDDFWDTPSFYRSGRADNSLSRVMHTDVKEKENAYEVAMNLPGFKKEDVQVELKDGYLTVNASQKTSNDETDQDGKYIRRERYSGSCSRSFYVGEDVKQEDIKAKFEDGVLKLDIPKKEEKPAVDEKKYIPIEG